MKSVGDILAQWRSHRPRVVDLAEVLALALRAEPALVRQARLLVGDDTPATEADLWFSPLVESHSARGIVLDPEVAAELRRQLARRDPVRFEQARALVASLHAAEPWSIRVEEALYHLSARYSPGDRERCEALLVAVGARLQSESSPEEVARWILRALDRMPSDLPALETARALSFGAGVHLDGRMPDIEDVDPARNAVWLPANLATTDVHVRRQDDYLDLAAEPFPGSKEIRIPRTEPRVVDVVWHDGMSDHIERVRLRAGESRRLRIAAASIELRTLLGGRFGIVFRGAPEEPTQGLDFTAIRAAHRPFFGREREQAELHRWLESGQGVMILHGPPGVGKTALLCRILEELETDNVPIVAHFLDGGPQHWAQLKVIEASLRCQLNALDRDTTGHNPDAPLEPLPDLLARIARQRPGGKASLVVALDGIGLAPNVFDVMALVAPPLPPGVQVLATKREARGLFREAIDLRLEPDLEVCAAYLDYHVRRLGDLETQGQDPRPMLLERSAGFCGRLAAMLNWLAAQPPVERRFDRIPPTLYDGFKAAWEALAQNRALPLKLADAVSLLSIAREPLALQTLSKLLTPSLPAGEAPLTDPEFSFIKDLPNLFLNAGFARLVPMENVDEGEDAEGPWLELAHPTLRTAVIGASGGAALHQWHRKLAALRRETTGEPSSSAYRYGLRHEIHHLAEASELEAAATTATDIGYLNEVLASLGPEALLGVIDDAKLLTQVPTGSTSAIAEPLKNAIALMSAVLVDTWSQFKALPTDLRPLLYHSFAIAGWSDEALESTFGSVWAEVLLRPRGAIEFTFPPIPEESWPATAWVRLPMGRYCGGDTHGVLHLLEPGDSSSQALPAYASAVRALCPARPASDSTTPDSEDVIAAYDNGHVVRWSVPGGTPVWDVEPHAAPVFGLRLLPNGRIASWSADGTAAILDAETGQPASRDSRLVGSASDITAFGIHADSSMAFTGSRDGTLRRWALSHGRLFDQVIAHPGGASCLALDPNRKRVLTAGETGVARLWEIDESASPGHSLREVAQWVGHQGPIRACGFRPNGDAITCGQDGTVRLWRVESPSHNQEDPQDAAVRTTGMATEQRVLRGHRAPVLGFENLESGGFLTFAEDGSACVWDVSLNQGARLEAGAPILAAFHDPARNCFWLGTAHGRLIALEIEASNDATAPVRSCAISHLQSVLFSTTRGTTSMLVDEQFSETRHTLDGGLCSYAPSADLWITATEDELFYYSRSGGERIASYPVRPNSRPDAADITSALDVSTSGTVVALGYRSGLAILWDRSPESTQLMDRFYLWDHPSPITSIALSEDVSILGTTSEDGTLALWNAENGERMHLLTPQSGPLHAVAFSPGHDLAVTGAANHLIHLWDTRTGILVTTLSGHHGPVRALRFVSNGQYLVSVSEDATLRLWDLESRRIPEVYHGRSAFTCLASAPTTDTLGAGDHDGRLWLFHLRKPAPQPTVTL